MRCPECTQDTPDDAAECPKCGFELAAWRKGGAAASVPEGPSGLELAAPARPKARQPPRPAPQARPSAPERRFSPYEHLGFLVSGVFFVLWGLISTHSRHNLPPGTSAYVGNVLDQLMGAGLVAATFGSPSSRLAALGRRLGMGLVLLTLLGAGLLVVEGMYGFAVIGLCIAFINGMFLLTRVSIVQLVLSSLLLAVLLAFGALASARNATALELTAKLARTIRGQPITEVQGRDHKYQFRLPPSTRWFESTILPKNSDRRLISPATETTMSIRVLKEQGKDTIDELGNNWFKLIAKDDPGEDNTRFEETDREHLQFPTDGLSLIEGLLIRFQYIEEGRSYNGHLVLIRKGKTVYLLTLEGPTEDYVMLANEMRTTFEGFVPADDTPPVAPTLTPAPKPVVPAPVLSPAERQAACRRNCQSYHAVCDCPVVENPTSCKKRCNNDLQACFNGCH